MAALGDTILVSGSLEDLTWFQIIRPMQTIADPDTGKPLALAGLRVGAAYLLRQGPDALHQFRVVSSDTEILIGDRLVPSPNRDRQRWLPHPAPAVSGRVASVLRGATWASVNDVIAINRGLRQGLDAGSVVAVVRCMQIELCLFCFVFWAHSYEPARLDEARPSAAVTFRTRVIYYVTFI